MVQSLSLCLLLIHNIRLRSLTRDFAFPPINLISLFIRFVAVDRNLRIPHLTPTMALMVYYEKLEKIFEFPPRIS